MDGNVGAGMGVTVATGVLLFGAYNLAINAGASLIPPLTIVLSLVFLSETPPGSAYLGGALALLGVAIAQRTGWARRPTPSP